MRSAEECKMSVALPEPSDGSSLAKGIIVELTTEWKLCSIDLSVINPSPTPRAAKIVFYLNSTLNIPDVPEGGTKSYDIWIDDI